MSGTLKFADLSRVRTLPDISCSSSEVKWSLYYRALFWRPAEGKRECEEEDCSNADEDVNAEECQFFGQYV